MARGEMEDVRLPTAQVPHTLITRIAGLVLRHRRWIIAFWLVVLVAGIAGAGRVSQRLAVDFTLPGQPGYEAAKKVTAIYGNGGQEAPSILVVTAPTGQSIAGAEGKIAATFQAARATDPSVRIVDYASTRDRAFLTADGRSTYALVFTPLPKSFNAQLASKHLTEVMAKELSGYGLTATGLGELSNNGSTHGPGVLAETMLGAAGALIVLGFVFASFLALLPLLIAAVSILSTLLIILGLTYATSISFVVQFLVALVGLGVAIDYSLLVVTRWREERAHGRDNEQAVIVAMGTAGRAVVVSGVTVGIGLLALVVLPVPGLRSIGWGGMLIPLVSVLVTLTLLPAILGGTGPRLDWPRVRHEARASRPWTRWAQGVVRHRRLAAGVAVAILAVLCVPFFGLKIGLTGPAALSKSGTAAQAYDRLLAGGVPSGVLTPIEVLTSKDSATAAQASIATVPGISAVARSSAPDSNKQGTTVLVAFPNHATLNASTSGVVTDVRRSLNATPGVIGVTGVGSAQIDYMHAVYDNFPLMLSVIAVLTFLLLARAFRSVLLPIKAVILNLLSLAGTFGAITWFWQHGHGSSAVFGIPATGAITFWVPLMIFAFLFGLSMDYEVFILSRVREEYDRTGSTNRAVVEGLARTGRLVTSAALILFLAFASLASAPFTDIKVFATALGFGILLDATVVRALLLPALVSLFGRANWWLPSWAERPLALTRQPERTTGLEQVFRR